MTNITINNKKKGFTLIELLIAFGIVGILSASVAMFIGSYKIINRDEMRKEDMKQLKTVLNIYFKKNNHYPICSLDWKEDEYFSPDYENGSYCYNNVLKEELVAVDKPLLDKLPHDPINPENLSLKNSYRGHNTYIYRYISDEKGLKYILAFVLEKDKKEIKMTGE